DRSSGYFNTISSFRKERRHEAAQAETEKERSWPSEATGQLILMRWPPNELKALDRGIKADGALLSRQQAIRRILSVALGKATQKASRRRQFLLRFLSDRGGAAAVRFSVIR